MSPCSGGVATAPTLLARLARALFDPAYEDDDSFVAKGRPMFEGRISRLEDPAISREIGMLLGNDLGQMRIQFNAKTYVVEPVYRDDGLGLWDFATRRPPPPRRPISRSMRRDLSSARSPISRRGIPMCKDEDNLPAAPGRCHRTGAAS